MARLVPLYDNGTVDELARDIAESIVIVTAGFAPSMEPYRLIGRDLFAAGWRKLPEEATAGLDLVDEGAGVTFAEAARMLQGQDPHHRVPAWPELPENVREWWRAAIVALAAVVGSDDTMSTPPPLPNLTEPPVATASPVIAGKDWYEAFAEAAHRIVPGWSWEKDLTPEQEAEVEAAADKVAGRPEEEK